MPDTDRRDFLKLLGAAMAAWGFSPLTSTPARAADGDPGDCDYWESLRSADFSLHPGRIYLNNSTLGPTLLASQTRMAEVAALIAGGISLNDFVFQIVLAVPPIRALLDSLINAYTAGGKYVGMVSSVTEGMSLVANGLDISAGDAILTTDHEHTGGFTMWELQRDRYGATLLEVPLLVPGQPEDEWASSLLARFEQALIDNPVKVVSFSYVTTSTGHVLPAKELCALARSYGAVSVIDAAQAFAILPLDVADLDCDFMVMNGHKYLCGTPGSGFVVINPRWYTDTYTFWPTIVDSNYYTPSDPTKYYPQRVGGMKAFTNLLPLLEALTHYETVGPTAVYNRLKRIGQWFRTGLSRYPAAFEILTPLADNLSCVMTSFRFVGQDSETMTDALYNTYNIQAKHSTEGGADAVRLAPHYYNTTTELEQVAQAICALAGVAPADWFAGNTLCDAPAGSVAAIETLLRGRE